MRGLIDIKKNGVLSVTDKDKACDGTFSENVASSDGLLAMLTIMTEHAEVHRVIEGRSASPQADAREIKQNVFATHFTFQ